MNNSNKGGRGKRAPYETVMCRTPKPIKAIAEQLTAKYRELVDNYDNPEDPELIVKTLESIALQENTYQSTESTESTKYLNAEISRLKEEIKHLQQTGNNLIHQKIQWYESLQENPVLKTQVIQLQEEILQLKTHNQWVISNAITKFIEVQELNHGRNGAQKEKEFTLNTRKWDAFRDFMKFIKQY